MPNISFSVDEDTKKDIQQMAKEQGKSQSEVLRESFKTYKFRRQLQYFQQKWGPKARELGIENVDDVEEFFG